jgi:zinc protease
VTLRFLIPLVCFNSPFVPLAAQVVGPERPLAPISVPSIPYEKVVLPNGLTVLLASDHRSPVVHVTVWHHVGSKNEVRGRTGFAHLFEHLMFEGSEHVAKGEHIRAIEDMGGEMNGETAFDRTRYYETVPANQLETVLWLESDRMGYFLPALTQTKLDHQRDVVKNERRQTVDNVPFGSEDEVLLAALFPQSSPYSWPVIGSMTDLSAASLEDVKDFFRRYYAPSNAVLAIAGDIDVQATRAMVERYFGNIPAGPPIARPVVVPTPLAAEQRLVLEDARATEPRLEIAWPTVGDTSSDVAALRALGDVLTYNRTSRLTKVLVFDRQLASSVSAGQGANEDAGHFEIDVTPRPGASMTVINRVVDSVVVALRSGAASVTAQEVDGPKRGELVGAVLGLQTAQEKAETLAGGQTLFGDPEHYKARLARAQAVTPADVQRVAQHYLGTGRVVLSMVPKGKLDLVSEPTAAYTNVTPTPEGK